MENSNVYENLHIRVERTLIRSDDHCFKSISKICQITRRIKNRTQYILRHAQSLFGEKMNHRDVDKYLKQNQPELYRKHPAAIAQRTTQICGAEWKSYFAALRLFKKTPDLFKAKPRAPGYSRCAATTYMGRNAFAISEGMIRFPKELGLPPIPTKVCKQQEFNAPAISTVVREIRIVPTGNCYCIEVIYDASQLYAEGDFCLLLDKKNIVSMDMGIDNLAALASNQPDISPVLINGKVIKSINALYNKDCAVLRSCGNGGHLKAKSIKRYNRIRDYIHRCSRFIVNFCVEHNHGTIVIGKSVDWKQSVNMGTVNNQKFVSIPHATLIDQIKYKASVFGITVIVREESYTSKASALDLDVIPNYGDNVIPLFSGCRTQRGLYKSPKGIINADVNGALNIARKEFGDAVLTPLINGGCVFQPVRISLHRNDAPKVIRTKRIAAQVGC